MARRSTAGRELGIHIMEELFRLLEKKRFVDISVRELVQCAGVSRSTYYRNFSCKEDIVRRFFDLLFQEYEEEYQKNISVSPVAARSAIFYCFYRHREQLLLLYRNGLLYLLQETFQLHLGGPEESYEGAYHVGGMYSVLRLWLSRDMRETPEEVIQPVLEIIRQGYGVHRSKSKRRRSG